MFKIGAITVTRRSNYDNLKHLIAQMILLTDEKRLPSAVHLSKMLDINKSSISRAIINLCEQDKWIKKVNTGNPRTSYYIIIANQHQAESFKNYYLLPPRKKVTFKKQVEHAKQKHKNEVNIGHYFGCPEWDKFHQQYLSFGIKREVKTEIEIED